MKRLFNYKLVAALVFLSVLLLGFCSTAAAQEQVVVEVPTTEPTTTIEGYLDAANCDIIGGWAFSRTNPTTQLNLIFVADGEMFSNTSRWIGMGLTNGLRPDILANYGVERAGFTRDMPAMMKDGKSHVVRAYVFDIDPTVWHWVMLKSPIPMESCGPTISGYVSDQNGNALNSAEWPWPSVSLSKMDENGEFQYIVGSNSETGEGAVMNGNFSFRGIPTDDKNKFTPFSAGRYAVTIWANGKKLFYKEFGLGNENVSLGNMSLQDYPVQVELSNIRQEGEALLADIVVRNSATVPMDLQQYGQYAPSYTQAYMYSYYFGEGQSASGTVVMTIPTDQPKGWQVCIGFSAVERGRSSNKLGESSWGCVVVK